MFIIPYDQFSLSGLQKLFLYLKILINIFNNTVDKIVNEKYYGKTDTEKVDLGRLYLLSLYNRFFSFLLFILLFT